MKKNCRNHRKRCEKAIEYPPTDYIVIGAGAAGSVVAARLAEAGYTVRVLEAGPNTSPDNPDPDQELENDIRFIQQTYEAGRLIKRFNKVENSCACGLWQGNSSLLDFVTVPQKEDHRYSYPRAAGAGGCSSHHGMVDGIGPLGIYDKIAEKVGDDYWKGSNMKLLFNKMENFNGFAIPCQPSAPSTCNGGEAPGHGYSGWLNVINGYPIDSLNQKVIDSAVDKGVKCISDFGEDGSAGIGPVNTQAYPDATRSYAYKDLLIPIKNQTGNIDVKFNTLVDKIILDKNEDYDECVEGSNKYKARCVKAYEKEWLQPGQSGGATFTTFGEGCEAHRPSFNNPLPKPSYFYANKEVIVCGGAIQSPTILMRSGIGPKEHLKSVGVKCRLNRPGVGSDITDHCETFVVYEMNPRKYMPQWLSSYYKQTGLINQVEDCEIMRKMNENAEFDGNGGQSGQIQMDWCSGVSGVDFNDTHNYFAPGFFWSFDADFETPHDPEEPHDQHPWRDLFPDRNNPIPYSAGLRIYKDMVDSQFDPKQVRVFVTWGVENLIPGITPGTIRLKNSDPRSEPLIDEKLYLDDKGIERMARIFFLIREIMEDPIVKENGMPDYETVPGPKVQTVEQMMEFIKNWTAFGHHISGGCQMSKPEEERGVCTSRLKVRGVEGLRVADTSVYPAPWLHGFNTVRGAYLMGEACADIILNE